MKKLDVLWTILGSIVFVMFNALFFATRMAAESAFITWSTYVFIVISFIAFIATPILAKQNDIKKVFGILSTEFGALYFAIQLALGLCCLLIDFEPALAFIVQLFLLAAYAIIIIVKMIVVEKAINKSVEQENE